MTTKAVLVIEKFNEGITLHWNECDGEQRGKSLAINGNEAESIGAEIWSDVYNMMDKTGTDTVVVKLEYQQVEEVNI